MFVLGENPMMSEPNQHHARHSLEQLEFIVCQDIFINETGEMADVILPATSFAEKDGTFTNTDRRVQRCRTAVPPVGQLPRRLGHLLRSGPAHRAAAGAERLTSASTTPTPSDIWEEMRQ
jgi:predicted molibdopterin-dependent oxidoreductase YjgC